MSKKTLRANKETRRSFSYSQGNASLNFTLRIDVKSELKDFLELLKIAVEDVTKEIKDN